MDYATAREQQTNLDLLVAFEAEMDKREQDGVVIALPESEARFHTMQQSDNLRDIIWQRLYSLGYAPQATLTPSLSAASRIGRTTRFVRRNVIESVEEKYTKAVKKFQADSGSTPDGWVGLQTWECLQQLFNFEHNANLQKWTAPRYQNLLYRAIHLRMIILGIADKPTKGIRASGDKDRVQWLLQHWRQWLIGCTAQTTDPDVFVITAESPDIDVAEYLFDIDKLTRLVSTNLNSDTPIETAHFTLERIERVSKCLLKVELWLYGVDDIQPGSRGPLSAIRYTPASDPQSKARTGNALSKAVSRFLDEAGVDVPQAKRRDEAYLIKLAFRHLNLLDDSQAGRDDIGALSQQLSARISDLKPTHAKKFEQEIKQSSGFGAWFFDGLKRMFRKIKQLWNSIKDFFLDLSDRVVNFLEMLANATKKLVSDTFSAVKRSFQILSDGFQFITQPEIIDREHYQVGFRKDKDMDLTVFVANHANSVDVTHFWQRIDAMMLRTKAAMVIANWIIELTFNVITHAMSGLLGFVMVMLKLHKMLSSDEVRLVKAAYISYE